jgi:DNA polymerase-1
MDTWLPRAIARLAPEFLPEEKEDVQSRVGMVTGKTIQNIPGKVGSIQGKGTYEASTSELDVSTSGFEKVNRECNHSWCTVLRDYAVEDAITTLALWEILKEALEEEDLYPIYQHRMKLLRVTYDMEEAGVTLKPRHLSRELVRYKQGEEEYYLKASATMALALPGPHTHQDVNLRSSKQLQKILYGRFQLPQLKTTPSGQGSTDEETLKDLLEYSINHNREAARFIGYLWASRSNRKAAEYLDSYKLWSLDNGQPQVHSKKDKRHKRASTKDRGTTSNNRTLIIHPSINVTGTKFTRQSSNSPNLQNVGTGKEEVQSDTIQPTGVASAGKILSLRRDQRLDYNLRTVFGPTPGREWWDFDYSNLELRIWAYSCGNEELIDTFEKGLSAHLIIARQIHPGLNALADWKAKETSEYKRVKNGNFSIIYGAGLETGDRTYGTAGAYERLVKRFPEVKLFSTRLHSLVEKKGYITTRGGYRLYVPTNEPHKAVSAYVQGTAGDVIGMAMINCFEFLDNHRSNIRMILQIHDELLFDVPKGGDNHIARNLMHCMSVPGRVIGVPTPVSGKRITTNWGEGEPIV